MATLHRVRKYQRGPCWYVDTTTEDGTRKRISLGPISEADAELKRQHLELTFNGRTATLPGGPNVPAGPLFAAFVKQEYLPWHRGEFPSSFQRTEAICRMYLIPELGHRKLGDITIRLIEQHKTRRRPHAKPATVAKELNTIQAILNKAVEWEVIPRNRARGVKAPQNLDDQPAPFYVPEELERIYAQSPGKWPIWKLLANTGLRRNEAMNLKWENVRDNALYVVSTPTARSKSRRYRVIPLGPGAREALAALKNASPYVLPRMAPDSLSRAFDHVLERSGLSHSLHALRHTFCSHLVMRGVDLKTVQELAGHSSIIITMKLYTHLTQEHKQTAVQQLDL